MDAGDALCGDARASSAIRRDTVIYQGTEKGNVSEREVEERNAPAAFLGCGSRFSVSLSGIEP